MNTKKAHETTWVPQWGFGDRLRKVRTDIGYTQEEMAELLELKAATLSSYESGRANPRATALPALAARLELLTKVPRTWFMGWDDEAPHPHNTDEGPSEPPVGLEPTTCALQGGTFSPIIDIFTGREAS